MFSGLKKVFNSLKEKILTTELSKEDLKEELWRFELKLVENNVAAEIAHTIVDEIASKLETKKFSRFEGTDKIINSIYRESLENLLEEVPEYDLINEIKKNKPYIILFVGINGTGKTTSIAKICNFLKNKYGFKCLLACADTFRAGAIEQLESHAKVLNVMMIKHKYGSSPTAVAYDAVMYAKKYDVDVVLIDTAGRMDTDINLINEMKKLVRVIKPNAILLVVDSLSGNDAYYQAEIFNKELNITGYILTKVDADERGGTILSLIYSTKKPILFVGTGTSYEDIIPINKEWIISKLLE
ncbi:MAG: signal recognition particle-docking protein FtsY [Thermoproteota archaeon]|jgi:signal recognition particle-docking protein FtsY